jgi:ABC-type hemin transport system ATPase subunit
MAESAAELMARVAPSRVIFVLGWSGAAKDGILRKLTGSAGARDGVTFDTGESESAVRAL